VQKNFQLSTQSQELDEPEIGVLDTITTASKVILFNDEIHTFEEVINQILKATGCPQQRAEELTWEVHSSGKACVYSGEMVECLRVSSILEEIGLHTQIEC
jgi:ATP-dependent Clp protease adaptor protein ClpS